MTPPNLRPLSVGEILDTSFSLYRRHFGALATVSLICTGLPLVLRLFVEAAGASAVSLFSTGISSRSGFSSSSLRTTCSSSRVESWRSWMACWSSGVMTTR